MNMNNTNQPRRLGRPRLTPQQRAERDAMKKVAFYMTPDQVQMLENWIEDQMPYVGKKHTKASAALALIMGQLAKDPLLKPRKLRPATRPRLTPKATIKSIPGEILPPNGKEWTFQRKPRSWTQQEKDQMQIVAWKNWAPGGQNFMRQTPQWRQKTNLQYNENGKLFHRMIVPAIRQQVEEYRKNNK